ncbi:MAG: NAD(P)/FAD-dependent oxidoreductase [Solirubrobacteraceae bacterium]
MAAELDALIIGGGHNGLVTAFYLARAGLRVEVLEAQPVLGGACKTEELIPGYRFSTCANYLWLFRPKVLADMRLLERGLTVDGVEVDTKIIDGTQPIVWWHDEEKLQQEIARVAPSDAARWAEWQAIWSAAAELFGPHLLSYPPSLRQLEEHAARIGQRDLLATLMTSSLGELADRYLETDVMRASINDVRADLGSLYAKGSSMVSAVGVAARDYSEIGRPAPKGYVRGGMGSIVSAMADALSELDVSVRTSSPVERILVEGGRAIGVRLVGGEEVFASTIVSNTTPDRTYLSLLEPGVLDADLVKRVQGIRREVAPLKLHCAMSRLPEYSAFAGSELPHRGPLLLLPSREGQERTWLQAGSGELPDELLMAAMTPSVWDATLAPDGCHTVSFWILYVPVRPAGGTWEQRREEMAEKLLSQIGRYAPDFRDALQDYVLFTPADLQERVLLTDGNIHHADMVPSQALWQRPIAELAHYRAPIAGLYCCGAGQHPGGEVTGAPGHNAAHVVLEDLGHVEPGTWQQISEA